MARRPASRVHKNIQDKKSKKCRNDDRLNEQKKFYSWAEYQAQMDKPKNKRKEWGNDDRLNKRKKFYSWPGDKAQMDVQNKKRKEWRNDDRLNKRKKFYSWPGDQAQMDIQNKKRKEWRNDDRLNKRKNFYSWPGDQEYRRWQTTVPHDILSIISDLLPLSDFINFRGVCHNWRSVPSCRSNITELSKKDPWCILYDFDAQNKDMCLLYQCNDRRSCSVKLPGLRGAKCFVSKHGWLLIRRNDDFLFFNPLTLEEIFLPKYPTKLFRSSDCQVGTFSVSPSSKDCVVVLMSLGYSSTVYIASCRLAANKWTVTTFKFDDLDVAFDSVLLPSPRYLYFCPIKNFSRIANCGNKIKRIDICFDNHYLMFDLMFARYKIGSLLIPEEVKKYDKYFKISDWYSKLKEVHSDDWICKFGKEFTFSFCLFNDCKMFDDKHVFGADYRTIPNVPVIKAAWLYND